MYCENCGQDNGKGANFCRRCGQTLKNQTVHKSEQSNIVDSLRKVKKTYVAALLVVISVVAFLVVITGIVRNSSPIINIDEYVKLQYIPQIPMPLQVPLLTAPGNGQCILLLFHFQQEKKILLRKEQK